MTESTESAQSDARTTRRDTSASQEPQPPVVVANVGLANLADRTADRTSDHAGERLGMSIDVADVAEVGERGTTSDESLIVDIPVLLGDETLAELDAPLEPRAPREVIGHWRPLEQLQAAAQRLASEHALGDYQARLADNSRRAHWGDLKVFAQYVLTATGGGARPSIVPASASENAALDAVDETAVEATAPSGDNPLGPHHPRHFPPHLQLPANTRDEPAPGAAHGAGDAGQEPTEPDVALVTAYAMHLLHDPTAWADLRFGVVVGFVRWQLAAGYAIQSINRRLSTVKAFAQIAVQAGALAEEHARVIATVAGFGRTEGRHLDAQRPATRRGRKKAQPVAIPLELARRLKYDHPETPQGRRDALIMCLLLDHGLRCGEVVELQVEDFTLEGGPTDARMRFYRRKVDMLQTHRLTVDTYLALARYLTSDRMPLGAAHPAPATADHPEADGDHGDEASAPTISAVTHTVASAIQDGEPIEVACASPSEATPAPPTPEQSAPGDAAPGPNRLPINVIDVAPNTTNDGEDAGGPRHQDTCADEEVGTADATDATRAGRAGRAGAHATAQPLGDAAAPGPLLCGSRRGGRLTHVGMRANALSARVRALGAQIELGGRRPLATLSPHDCRHYWATMAFRAGADIKAVQDAGGWSSAAMPMLYALAAEIANEGIVLPR